MSGDEPAAGGRGMSGRGAEREEPRAPDGSLLLGGLRIPAGATDVLLAAGVAAIAAVILFAQDAVEPAAAVLLAGILGLAVLTKLPIAAAALIGGSVPAYYMLTATDSFMAWSAFVVGVVRLGATGHRASAVTATAVVLVISAVGEVFAFSFWRAVSVLAWALVVLLAGEIARSHRAYVREVQRRAVEAERTREEEGRRRAVEERMRIARELHDVIAHSISLINVQAGAAAHRRDDPEAAFAALDRIKAASRQTLRELRSTLGVLRQVDEDDAPTAPVPSLNRVSDLVDQTAAAGLPVRLAVEGDPVPLPAAVDLAAYRIVQEALTNALRHSGAASAEVAVDYGAGRLIVTVADDGRGAAAGGEPGGNGLRGMRERAAAAGGTCTAGPRAQVSAAAASAAREQTAEPGTPDALDMPGFAVRAEFPLPPPAAADRASTTAD